MPGAVRGKALFASLVIALSLVLWAAAWLLQRWGWYVPAYSGFIIPALAVMVAALGIPWQRKAVGTVLTVLGFAAFDALARATGVLALISQPTLKLQGIGLFAAQAAGILYAIVPLIYPIVVLVLFVGRKPSDLWTPEAAPEKVLRKKRRH